LEPGVKDQKNSSLAWMWLAFLLFFVLILVFILPLIPNDFWWYLRLGQDILRTGSLPAVDAYSFTAAGTPFIYHAWLSAVSLWLTFQAGGVPLTFVLQGIVLGLFYLFFWLSAREVGINERLATLLLIVAALAGSNNWQTRPQIFGYLLFAITVWIVLRWQNGKNGTLLLVPLIGVLWINLHGSFIMLYICLGSALVFGAGQRKLLLAALASVVVFSLLNPDGIRVFSNTWSVLFDNASNKYFGAEWQPPVNRGWQMNIFFMWLLALIPLAYYSSRKIPILLWVWLLGFGWMALTGERYVFWVLPIAALVTGLLLQPWVERYIPADQTRQRPWLAGLLALGLLAIPFAFLPGIRERWWQEAPPAIANSTPVEAAQWLKDHPELPGQMWNDYAYGSYLIYALPERKVWIDTRLYPYSTQHMQDYLTVSQGGYGWQEILRRDGVQLVFAYRPDQPDLIRRLNDDPGWCAVYWDDYSAIFSFQPGQESCPKLID
jgi:hypothetical protein